MPEQLAGRILLVEDHDDHRAAMAAVLRSGGHEVTEVATGEEARRAIRAGNLDAVVSDLRMPGVGGLDVLRAASAEVPPIPLVIVTGYATVESAVEAMRLGAVDYVVKPADAEDLLTSVHQALERRRMLSWAGTGDHQEETGLAGLIGTSRQMRDVFDEIRQAAPFRSTVLITGESGTGKELVAQAIHALSAVSAGPFVPVNCAALPAELVESQLFGYEKGAFTGATQSRPGLFEAAAGGTLFLDEISELAPAAQAKLLRAVEEGRIRRLGAVSTVKVESRLLAASNTELLSAIAEGVFREDLYYRLNVIHIEVPPLRERRDDIPLLLRTLLDRFCAENDLETAEVLPEALAALTDYGWPGNVRELKHTVERAVILCQGKVIQAEDIALGGGDRRRRRPKRNGSVWRSTSGGTFCKCWSAPDGSSGEPMGPRRFWEEEPGRFIEMPAKAF
ncbi:MAG: sigma-54 dependent transcriptional regulator [Acidobacteriota bacterium]